MILAVLTYVSVPLDIDTEKTFSAGLTANQDFSPNEFLAYWSIRQLFKISAILAAGTGFAWFASVFSDTKTSNDQVRFAYFFVLVAFIVFMIPPFVKSQAIGNEPIGIISGCVQQTEAQQVRCNPQVQNENGAKPAEPANDAATNRNQWLVNLGGALTGQPSDPICAAKPDSAECKMGSTKHRAYVTGGVVVPLPFVIIALFGGAISLSRRVPEIQKRADPAYAGSADEPALAATEARELLAFQILQFVSAPLIAITAYQVIQPSSQASAVALAFMAGFGSETILLIIRGVAEGIAPKSVQLQAGAATGAVRGTVTMAGQPVPKVELAISGTALRAVTDDRGGYWLGDVAPGQQEISVAGKAGVERRTVRIVAGETASCDIALEGTAIIGPRETPIIGNTPSAAPAARVTIRLVIEGDEDIDPGTLVLAVNGTDTKITQDGFVELMLDVGREYQLVAIASKQGQQLRGTLRLTPAIDDEGKPYSIQLA
ncbi:MAG TPA: carboxypeptidase-like regulatory domain-containing protein [Telluria sp.]|nr:carboxypeptidase-like regulatory domain-containing protein [Telluria sp.]